jgi:hypothetical protein
MAYSHGKTWSGSGRASQCRQAEVKASVTTSQAVSGSFSLRWA